MRVLKCRGLATVYFISALHVRTALKPTNRSFVHKNVSTQVNNSVVKHTYSEVADIHFC